MNGGLLVLRVAVGALLIGHGAQKLRGWFGGARARRNGRVLPVARLASRAPARAAVGGAGGAIVALAATRMVKPTTERSDYGSPSTTQ
jgi:uncharacterized membrane protein YphA (DoxX/SURF4 family)